MTDQPNPRVRYNGEYAIDQIVLDGVVWTPDGLRAQIVEREQFAAEVGQLRRLLDDVMRAGDLEHNRTVASLERARQAEAARKMCERRVVVLRKALEAVIYFWERDPEAFGDDASVTTLAGRFAAVANECRAALALSGREEGA